MLVERFEFEKEPWHGIGPSLANTGEHNLVGHGRWEKSEGGLLFASGALSSFMVAIHDTENKAGYLGHFPSQDSILSRTLYSHMLEDIGNDNPGNVLEGWIGGISKAPFPNAEEYELEEYYRLIDKDRKETADMLSVLRLSNLDKDWLDDQEIDNLTFNTETGYINYVVKPVDYLK